MTVTRPLTLLITRARTVTYRGRRWHRASADPPGLGERGPRAPFPPGPPSGWLPAWTRDHSPRKCSSRGHQLVTPLLSEAGEQVHERPAGVRRGAWGSRLAFRLGYRHTPCAEGGLTAEAPEPAEVKESTPTGPRPLPRGWRLCQRLGPSSRFCREVRNPECLGKISHFTNVGDEFILCKNTRQSKKTQRSGCRL